MLLLGFLIMISHYNQDEAESDDDLLGGRTRSKVAEQGEEEEN